ncbi:MAG: MFS transporter [Thermoplasmataceae archaeon]
MKYGNSVILASSLGSFLSVVNSTSLLIAIPTIMVDLDTSFFMVLWILISYSLTLTVFSPIFGKYSDRIGRKKLYSSGYIFFFVGSIIAGSSPNSNILVISRAIQGVGGALLFSNSLAIITDTFKAIDLKRAIAINAAVIGFGTAVGPIVGGLLTVLNWRSIFFFNAPIALIGYVVSWRYLKEISREHESRRFDYGGAALFSAFMVLVIVPVSMGPFIGWTDPPIPIMLVLSVVSLLVFAVIEGRTEDSMISTELFRNRIFSYAALSTLLNSVSRYSLIFILILYLQGPAGFSPMITGFLMIPYAGSMGAMSYYSSLLMDHASGKLLQVAGLLLVSVGAFLFTFSISVFNYIPIAILMIVTGLGIGIFYTPNNSALMLSVRPGNRGVAAAIRTLFLNMGSVIGMTMVFTVVASFVSMQTVGDIFLGTLITGIRVPTSAFTEGLVIAFVVSGLFSLIAVPLIVKKARQSS